MTNPLAQDLGGVVLLPCPFCGAENAEVQKWLWWVQCNECDSNGPAKATEAEAIAAWNTRAHSAEIAGALRDAERWQPIESAPRDGTYILVCNSHGAWIAKWNPVFQSGFRPSNPWASMMLNHDHIERPGRFDHPTHWRPLPAPQEDSKNGV